MPRLTKPRQKPRLSKPSTRPLKLRHKPKYVVDKGGRLYWQPSVALRQEGWGPRRLPDNRVDAYRAADELNRQLDLWRAGKAKMPVPDDKPEPGSVAAIITRFRASKDWLKLRERTRRDYSRHLDGLKELIGLTPIQSVSPRVVQKIRDHSETLGARQGPYRMQVLRLLLSFAYRVGEIDANPAERAKVRMPKAREAVWSEDQVAQFYEHAPPDMALAMALALWTGQRQADVLAMRWSDIRKHGIEVVQQKTGKKVTIPLSAELGLHITNFVAAEGHRSLMILSGSNGAPLNEHTFRKAWNKVTKAAGISGVTFQDLRRTAVCRLAEAGCTVPEIAAITGHSISRTEQIIDVYLRPTIKLAEAAIEKLQRHTRRG